MASHVDLSGYPLFLSSGEVKRRIVDVILGIVLPIFLIVATAYTIHFALHPVGQMVQIASNFSMSVPLIVWSSLGVVTAMCLTVQLARLTKFGQRMIRIALHPGPSPLSMDFFYSRLRIQTERYTTSDGVGLEGFWVETARDAPTAILFHGNGMKQQDMILWAEYYQEKGFNVFMAACRGYQTESGTRAGPNQEREASIDAKAARQFVLEKGVPKGKILAHGISLGGAYAAALGLFHGVKHVVLEQTFTKFSSVCANIVAQSPRLLDEEIENERFSRLRAKTPSFLLAPIKLGGRFLANTAYQSGSDTDNFNTLRKVKKMKGEILVIRAMGDELMPPRFGEELVKANYGRVRNSRLIDVEGEHCSFNFFTDDAAQAQFDRFLQKRGLISGDASHSRRRHRSAQRA